MEHNSYDTWISIYTDELQSKWEEERYELRKISMIYCAFQRELENLKTSLDEELVQIKTKIKRRDCLKKCENFRGLLQSEPFDELYVMNKENESPESVPLKPINLNEIGSEEFFIESPNTSTFFEKPRSPSPIKNKVIPSSPVINKPIINNSKKKTSPRNLYPVITHTLIKTPNLNKKSEELQTSKTPNDSNIMECSIIEDTPEANPSKKTKLSLARSKNSKKSKLTQSKQKNTLTQMLHLPKVKKKKHEINTNDPSMSINKIIDFINESSGSETDAGLDSADETIDNLNLPENSKNNYQSFVQNYDKLPEKKEVKHDEIKYNPPVRGKERKKLKGWACKECEEYYKGFNLPPEELEKKKDICSKHRYKFKRDETYKGFWDLTFGPTQKTPDSEKSTVFNYKPL